MKAFRYLIFSLIAILGLSFSTIVFASENPEDGFEFSSNHLGKEVMERIHAGETSFKIKKELKTSDPKLGNEIVVKVWVDSSTVLQKTARATETINWALSGRYYFKDSDETVSNYGNHGSVDYTGSSLLNAHWDVYHDLTYQYSDKYTATATDSEQSVTGGKKFVGKYRLKNKSTNNYADDAEIYIIVKNNGDWETKGNYSAININ